MNRRFLLESLLESKPPIFNNVTIYMYDKGGGSNLAYRVNGGSWVWCPGNYGTLTDTLNNVTKLEIVCEETPGVDYVQIWDKNPSEPGATAIASFEGGYTTSEPLDVTQYLQNGCYIDMLADD